MNKSQKTNISYTYDVFVSRFVGLNPTNNKYDVDMSYLLDSLIIQLDNTEYLYNLLSNNKIKVSNIAFLTLKDLIDLDLRLNHGNYYASNYQLIKLINQYELNNVLDQLTEYIEEERED